MGSISTEHCSSGSAATDPDAAPGQVCESEAEARRLSEAAEQRQRLERLALMSGGGSMITSKSLATGDDDEEALKRMNVILKVCIQSTPWSVMRLVEGSVPRSVFQRHIQVHGTHTILHTHGTPCTRGR